MENVELKQKGLTIDLSRIKLICEDIRKVRVAIETIPSIVLKIQCVPTTVDEERNVNFENFRGIMKQLEQKGFCFVSKIRSEQLRYSDLPSDKEVQMKFLKQIFGEIESRFDLLNNPLIESFLELKSFQKTNEKRIQSIFPMSLINTIDYKDSELSVIDTQYFIEKQQKNIAFCLQNTSSFSKIGRIWSILEKDQLGGTQYYRQLHSNGDSSNYSYFTQTCSRFFDIKVLCSYYNCETNLQFFGGNDGFLYHFRPETKDLQQIFQKTYLCAEPLLGVSVIGNNILLIRCQKSVKLFDMNKLELVGGGSLKKRLQNQDLTAHLVYKNYVYLGADLGELFLFELKENSLKFVESSAALDLQQITEIQCANEHLFLNDEKVCKVYKILKPNQIIELTHLIYKDLKLCKTLYLHELGMFVGGYSNGMIVFWNVEEGNIISCIRTSFVEINSISQIEEGLLMVGHSQGAKFLKFNCFSNREQSDLIKGLEIESYFS